MTRYIAFLRAVNVGGHTVFKLDVFVRSLEDAGLVNVSSYRQSGNIIFDSDVTNEETLKGKILEKLNLLTDVRTDVFLFRYGKLRSLIDDDPFRGRIREGDRAFATLMAESPAEIPAMPWPLQEGILLIDVIGEIALSVVREGVGSGPVNDLVETQFRVRASTRNWSSVMGVVEKAGN